MTQTLKEAAQEFVTAGEKYREYLKRHHPKRLAGVIWVLCEDGSAVMYTEGSRFSRPLIEATRKIAGNELSLDEVPIEDNE